jgi:hypothetical protein
MAIIPQKEISCDMLSLNHHSTESASESCEGFLQRCNFCPHALGNVPQLAA